MDAVANYGRYRDVDGDGSHIEPCQDPVSIRSLPQWDMMRPVFTPKIPSYRELMKRLKRKTDNARNLLPAPILREEDELDIGIIYMGSWRIQFGKLTTSLRKLAC